MAKEFYQKPFKKLGLTKNFEGLAFANSRFF